MDRILVAFEGERQRSMIVEALESAGLPVRRVCASGAQALYYAQEMGGALVICGFKVGDRTAEELAWDLGPTSLILMVARPEQLENCEHADVFHLAVPFSRTELISSVRMLQQLESMRLPRRTPQERELVRKAKALLMEKQGMTEEAAHRALQKRSMETGLKMAQAAEKMIGEADAR